MDLKAKLQLMLHIVEEAERNGALADIERDTLLEELRAAYTELKYGWLEFDEPKSEASEAPAEPIAPVVPVASTEESDEESDEENEVEVELIFDEEEPETEEPEAEKPEVEEPEPKKPEPEEKVVYVAPADDEEEPVVAEEEPVAAEEEPVAAAEELPIVPTTPKRSPFLSLYEDNPTPVVGEQFHDAPSVADTISCPKGVAESSPITSLRGAIGLADKFLLIHKLFDGNSDAFEAAITALEEQPTFDDCIIYISEHYAWPPHSEATKLIMELLQRKFNA